MLPGRTYTAEQILRIVRQRWWMLALPLVVGIVGGTLAYRWLPVKYRSETLIMVIPQRIPDAYVKSTVSANVEDRLRSVSEQILSRSRLERIIQDFDLYPKERRAGALEDVLLRMTNDIDVKLQPNETSFRVAYTSPAPAVAQQVTARLADLFIKENVRDRESLADDTSNFLNSQLRGVESAAGRPGEEARGISPPLRRAAAVAAGEQSSVDSECPDAAAVAQRDHEPRARTPVADRAPARRCPDPSPEIVLPGAVAADGAAPVSKAQQMESARARLDALKQRYTADHPDVLAQEQAIRDLQASVEEEASQPAPRAGAARSTAELARQKKVGDFQAEIAVIDRQLANAQSEENRLKQVMADVSGKIASVPTRESELVELTRDYATLQENYTSLLQKRSNATLAANLEKRQIGEQFKILDPASRPERPANEKQRLLALAGGPIGGLGLGVLLIGLLEYRDPSFRNEDDVLRVLSLPVLALVPVMKEHAGSRAAKRHRGAATIAMVMIAAAGSSGRLPGSLRIAHVSRVLRPSRAPVRADLEPEIPVPHEPTSGGAEQSAVRLVLGQGGDRADRRGGHRQDHVDSGGPLVGTLPARARGLGQQSRPDPARVPGAAGPQPEFELERVPIEDGPARGTGDRAA